MTYRTTTLALSVSAALAAAACQAAEPKPIPPDQFDRLHRMIRAQPDEQRFWRVGWKLSVTEARQLAAKQGKPMLIWAGAGGAPIGVC